MSNNLKTRLKSAITEMLEAGRAGSHVSFTGFEVVLLAMLRLIYEALTNNTTSPSSTSKPILVADNLIDGTYQPFFSVISTFGVLQGVSFQVLPNQTTSGDYWILAFDQSTGIPNEVPPHRVGFVRNGVIGSDGYDWSDFYRQGISFNNGIILAISTSSDRYIAPANVEIFLKVCYLEGGS